MDRAFQSGASASAPTPPASPSIGYATDGNPTTATPPTTPGEWWFHMVTEETRALVVAAGLTPSHLDVTQLLQALPGALASRPEMARSLAANGYQKLPGGLILQWGVATANTANGLLATFPINFPSACLFVGIGQVSSLLVSVEGVQVVTKTAANFSGATYVDVAAATVGSLTFGFFAVGY